VKDTTIGSTPADGVAPSTGTPPVPAAGDTGGWDTGEWDTEGWDTEDWDKETEDWDTEDWDTGTEGTDDTPEDIAPDDSVALSISVTNVNELSLAVPGPKTAYEDVDLAIKDLSVGDPEGDSLTVTLKVSHGKLTLTPTDDVEVSGNGSNSVTLSGSAADLNTVLGSLVYRGNLNYSGADTLSVTASDGSLSKSDSVAVTVKSAAEQAAFLWDAVADLRADGVLSGGNANALTVKLNLKGDAGDADKVRSFLTQVRDFLGAGKLSQDQADLLLGLGNDLLASVTLL
jgi:hypothetical protein